ncbi:phosphohistidine phosphatase SixA [Orbaceae bacterium ac157xtp]
MKIYIMRHAEAGYSSSSDETRTLTKYGEKQCEVVAFWFAQQDISFGLAMVSPYHRAQQTCTIISNRIQIDEVNISESLTPAGNPTEITRTIIDLAMESKLESLLVVSHLPLVGYLVNELYPYSSPPMFSTADVVCLSIDHHGEVFYEWLHHQN